jgi:micrococcal nuclease
VLSACTSGQTAPTTSAAGTVGRLPGAAAIVSNATVAHISDGDTIDVLIGKKRVRVRLLGVDTPESVKPNTPVQCFAKDASAFTAAMLPIGTAVRLERDIEPRDAYDRLLAYVYRADDATFVNLALALGGYARTLSIKPNTAHADELAAAVADATRAGRGLWGACPAFGAPASTQRHGSATGTPSGPSVPGAPGVSGSIGGPRG